MRERRERERERERERKVERDREERQRQRNVNREMETEKERGINTLCCFLWPSFFLWRIARQIVSLQAMLSSLSHKKYII